MTWERSASPPPPKRVVTLDWRPLEDLLLLGVRPVAGADLEDFPRWVRLSLPPGIQNLGSRTAPNLELLAALKPDLILGYTGFQGRLYPELSRIAPPVFGAGLLEKVPEAAILALEDPQDQDGDGISGRAARLEGGLGRFGWKASTTSLLEQSALAYREDMGLSTPLFPEEGRAEVSEEELERVTFYVAHLAVPAPRHLPEDLRGKRLFREVGCASCHRERLGGLPAYTDLLLHDMGEALADGVAEGAASPAEWRTPPLWGIGLTRKVLGEEVYLHDGRAQSLEEAILWHGGEAEEAKRRFMALPKADREVLLRFLRGL
ncbi:di-heme oxidoredictase family protein [Thermus thermophilus]|uniref:Cytochrome c domain-containing protein n=1 Tax=Thermus thermophilus TaxID=274 RepID=A0A7R7TFV1_THETH|nr:di-heme oxidoredictase family protein [Thermus thermophilus]BCP67258.1 hypothetical protein TthHB5018_b21920 [Thermus thermophilus]